MKLYATVTSERASKGQGGNEFIKIYLHDENNQIVCQMMFIENGLGYELVLDGYDEIGMTFTQFPCGYCKEKGKKQKGEHVCSECEVCSECGIYKYECEC